MFALRTHARSLDFVLTLTLCVPVTISTCVTPSHMINRWEIYPKELRTDKDDEGDKVEIGTGSFGVVHSGQYRRTKVAIKTVKLVT